MATQYFLVTRDRNAALPSKNGVDAMVVVAEDAGDAKAMCKSKHDGDNDVGWTNATATALAVAANLDGWTANVRVVNTDGEDEANVTVTGTGGGTVDTIAALLVTALNATTPIANASYDAGTNILTISSIADALGDCQVYVSFKPPAAANENPVAVPGFVGAIVDGGVAAAALTVQLAIDAWTKPIVTAMLKQTS